MGNNHDDSHFNPFEADLIKRLVKAFEQRELLPLPPNAIGVACGVYGIYYFGNFGPYKNLSLQSDNPIYIGKAVPPGGRKGGGDASKAKINYITKRLNEHSNSIKLTKTLSLQDFKCRWLSVDPHFVNSAESMLIDHYKPVWNSLITGFGIHNPGSGRSTQACSDWDMLHPGRPFAKSRPKGNSAESLSIRIKEYLKLKK